MQIQQSYSEDYQGGILYLVPTPIGNLDDMTYRAIQILRDSDVILAEDTRNSGILLKHFDISTRMQSFHEHTSQEQLKIIVEMITSGQRVSLISDAGMPIINDPGHPLVQSLLQEEIPVIALPGANAALTALVASGLAGDKFTYYGFFPRKVSIQEIVIGQVGQREETAIFYESPHRILASVAKLQQLLPEETQIVIAREITKKFESYLRGSVVEVYQSLLDRPIKGEIVLLIEGATLKQQAQEQLTDDQIFQMVQNLIDEENISPTQAIKRIAKQMHLKRNDVYELYHLKGSDE